MRIVWDAQQADRVLLERLRTVFDTPESFRTVLPHKWTPDKPPVVTVVSDGVSRSEQSFTVEMVRVSVYAESLRTARGLMEKIDSVLVTPSLRGLLCKITPATGVFVTRNSKQGGAVAGATYRVALQRKVKTYG